MDPRELARWMRDEHHQVEDLAAKLRTSLATRNSGPRSKWLADVQHHFEQFRAHFCRHITLEEDDGYLEAVLERQPTTSGEVERLKHEHQELTRIIDSIHGCVQHVSPEDQLLIQDCCVRIHNLLTAIDRHEQDENLIVSIVFTRDLGSKD